MTKRKENPYADGRGPKPLPIMTKLLRRSERRDECLVYTGGCDKDGYGKTWHDGKSIRAHVAAWIASNGPIPDGLLVLHHCDTPPCFRLEHLYLGTQLDNMQDRLKRGRWSGGRPPKSRSKS